MHLARMARWDAQMKGLTDEVQLVDDEQGGLHYSVKRKVRMLSKAPEEYCKTIFEELRELEDQKPRGGFDSQGEKAPTDEVPE